VTFGKNLSEPDRNGGFLRSADLGRTWQAFGEELRTQLFTEFDISQDGQTIIGNARDSFLLQVSRDRGLTWEPTSINQANGPLAISPADPLRVLYVTN
jgi:photosystem II stability/assembly factor-like uncharacterized protein